MIRKWKLINRKVLLEHPRISVFEDVVRLPDGKIIEYVHEGPAKRSGVAVIALSEDKKILVQRELSYPTDEILYQLPGGAMEPGEEITSAANRELSEESGYVGGKCTVLGSYFVSNRRTDKKQHLVLCEQLQEQSANQDIAEFIESEWMSLDQINELIAQGKISNMFMLAALKLLDIEKRSL